MKGLHPFPPTLGVMPLHLHVFNLAVLSAHSSQDSSQGVLNTYPNKECLASPSQLIPRVPTPCLTMPHHAATASPAQYNTGPSCWCAFQATLSTPLAGKLLCSDSIIFKHFHTVISHVPNTITTATAQIICSHEHGEGISVN